MNMKRIILFGLIGLLMAACKEGDDDPINERQQYNYTGDNSSDSNSPDGYSPDDDSSLVGESFEGLWVVDDTVIDQTYITSFSLNPEFRYVQFTTFPYEALVNWLLPDVVDYRIEKPLNPLIMGLSSVGYSTNALYYENTISQAGGPQLLSFGVVPSTGEPFTLTLEVLPVKSTYVISGSSASCILTLMRIKITYANEEEKTWVLNPEKTMIFTSTKKVG